MYIYITYLLTAVEKLIVKLNGTKYLSTELFKPRFQFWNKRTTFRNFIVLQKKRFEPVSRIFSVIYSIYYGRYYLLFTFKWIILILTYDRVVFKYKSVFIDSSFFFKMRLTLTRPWYKIKILVMPEYLN